MPTPNNIKRPTTRNAPYFWQATVETILPITACRFRKLRNAGECVWPASHPLVNNRAVPPNPTAFSK